MRVQFYSSSNGWKLYQAVEATKPFTWAFVHAPQSEFFEMDDPYDLGELRAHVCKDGETCGQKIDRAEESLKRNVLRYPT